MIAIDPQSSSLIPEAAALSKAALTRFLNGARKLIGISGEVELLLTSDAELKRLNRAFRNKNKATDILSFPTPPEVAQHYAGDLAISLETAARQAAQFGHTLSQELRILILHGLLHLSGLDHETDQGEMASRECSLRAALELPNTLISRTTAKPLSTSKSQATPKRRGSDTEQREAEGSAYLPLTRTAKKSPRETAVKRAKKRVRS